MNAKHRDQSFHYERLARAFAVDFYPKGQDYIIATWETLLFCFVDSLWVDRQSSQALYDLSLFGSFEFVSKEVYSIVTERIEKGKFSTSKKILVVFHWYSFCVVWFRLLNEETVSKRDTLTVTSGASSVLVYFDG